MLLSPATIYAPYSPCINRAADLSQLRAGIATHLSTGDLDATCASLERCFSDALFVDITPDMTVDNLLFALRKDAAGYAWERKAMWRALFEGRAVVLRHLSCNQNLAYLSVKTSGKVFASRASAGPVV